MAQTFKMYITTKVTNRYGKTVYKKTRACHSLVLAFLQILEVQLYPSSGVSIKDSSGSDNVTVDNAASFNAEGGATQVAWGIVVGTGSTPQANDDYVMETLIAHGSGATQLNYGATSKVAAQVVGGNVDFVLQRTFVNGSGGTINVTEFGIYMSSNTGSGTDYNLGMHDVVGAVAVLNGQTLTVTYTFRTTA